MYCYCVWKKWYITLGFPASTRFQAFECLFRNFFRIIVTSHYCRVFFFWYWQKLCILCERTKTVNVKVVNVTHFTYNIYVCEAGCKYMIDWSLSLRILVCMCVRERVCIRLCLWNKRVSVFHVEAIVCTKFIPKSMHPTSIAIFCLTYYYDNIYSIYINWSFVFRWVRISEW